MSAEQDLANANVQIANLISEVTRFRDAAMGLNAIYPTITEGRQTVADGKYFSVPGGGAYMRLYRRQGSSAELIAEFPDRAQVQSLVDTLGGRGVVGGSGDLMAVGAYGLGSLTGSSLEVSDFNTWRANGIYSGTLSPTNAPPGAARAPSFNVGSPTYGTEFVCGNGTDPKADNLLFGRRWRSGSPNSDWVKFFHSRNVLGPVSQSGGVPTGAIIERGSNANGEYFKYAGGMLICETELFVSDWETASFGASSYPAAFSSPPSVAVSVQDGGVIGFANSRSAMVVGRGSSWAYDIDGTGVNGSVYQNTLTLTAIGHWD